MPTISGTPTQGQTLTAGTDDISDADGLGSFSYQWQAGTDDIDSATSGTFVLTQDQVGKTITVKVSYTDDGNTAESLTSAATAEVTNTNDAPTGLPTISGTPTQGQTLTAGTDDISDADGLGSFSYQWQAGTDDIDSATSGTFVLTQDQVGKTITVTVSYTDDGNTAESLTSAATAEVTNTNDAPTGLPTISGTPTQGQTLTAGTDDISDADGLGSFSYQWQAGTDDIDSATSGTFVLTQDQVGKTITVTVSYTDDGNTAESLTSAATAEVTNTNDAPTGLPTISGTPTQGQTLTAGTDDISDADGLGSFSYQWQAGTDDISGATSSTFVLTQDQVGKTITVTVSYTDGGDTRETLTSVPTNVVTDVNDAPTITGATTFTIAENAGDGAMVGTIIGADVDAGTSLAYSITAGNTNDAFAIGSATGAITVNGDNKLDYETTPSYSLTVSVSDGDLAGTATVTITVTDIEEMVTFTVTVSVVDTSSGLIAEPISDLVVSQIPENTAYTATPATAGATPIGAVTWALSGDDATAFTIDATSGMVRMIGRDFEAPVDADNNNVYLATVIATDSAGNVANIDIAITVTNTNEAPAISGTTIFTIAENAGDGAMVGTIIGADVDAGTTLTYSIITGNTNDAFTIGSATGAITVNGDNKLDYETTPSYSLTVTVSDSSLEATATVTINVEDVNEAPTITGTPPATVAEDSAYSFTPEGGDIDANDTPSYALSNHPTWLIVNDATGTLSGTPTNTDVGVRSDIVLTITSGGETAALTFSITVTNTNDAPTITGTPGTTVAQDNDYLFAPVGADIDGDILTYSINTQPSWADFITTTGALSGAPTNNDIGITEDIVISVTDNIAEAVSLPAFSITVTNVNDAPTITGATTFTIAENADDRAMVGTITGADVDAGTTLTYSIIAGNTNDAFTIDSVSGDITVHGDNKLDHETTPSYSLMVTVSDGSLEATATVTINVEDVNEAPTITGTPPASIAQDTTYSFTPGGGDVDAGDIPIYSLSNNPTWLMVNIATGELSGTPTNADVGLNSRIVLSVASNEASATLLFDITVTNHAGNLHSNTAGTVTISGTAREREVLTATVTDADGIDGVSITYQWQAGTDDISGADEATFILTQAQVGQTITVIVSYIDGGGTAESLTSAPTGVVANVNDVPVGLPTISGTATQGQTLTAVISAISDADGLGTFSYQWLGGGSTINGATNPTYTLSQAEVGKVMTATASYTDGGGFDETLTSVATAEVTNVNDTPSGLPIISGAMTQGETLTAVTSAISDADGLGAFSYQWLGGGSTINGATNPTYTLSQAEVGKVMTVTASYTDGGNTLETMTSVATDVVTNANDDPVGLPTISGTPTQGETLTAVTSAISDADGLGAFSYQWLGAGNAINGATNPTYTLSQAEVGKVMTVTASYTDGGGFDETMTSAATDVVTNVNDAPIGLPIISGTPIQGETLSVDASAISDADGLGAFSYQWLGAGNAINGATSLTFILAQAQVGQAMTVTVSYTDGGNTLETVTSAATDLVANTKERIKNEKLNQAILPYLAQAVLASTSVSVEHRVDTVFSNVPRRTSYRLDGYAAQLNGKSTLSTGIQDMLSQKLPDYVRSLENGTMDWKQMLGNSSFVLSLNAAADSGLAGADRLANNKKRLTVWGGGEYTRMNGKANGKDAPDWSGRVFSVQLGVDRRVCNNRLLGGLLSWSESNVDYTLNGESGKYNRKMTSIHPYLAWSEGSVSLWGNAGYGQGKIEIREGDVTSNTDTNLLSLTAGIKKQLVQASGVSIKSDIALVRSHIDESVGIAEQRFTSQRLRLLLEVEGKRCLASSNMLRPVVGIGLRYDGGDGDTGAGAEMSMGMRYANPVTGLAMWSKARALLGRDDYKEWGIQGVISLEPGGDERGLSLRLGPSYGSTSSRMQEIWQQGLLDNDGYSSSRNNQDYGALLDAYLGYGLRTPSGHGLLLPYGEMTLDGGGKSYRLGLHWKRQTIFTVHIVGEQRKHSDGTATYKALLEGRIWF